MLAERYGVQVGVQPHHGRFVPSTLGVLQLLEGLPERASGWSGTRLTTPWPATTRRSRCSRRRPAGHRQPEERQLHPRPDERLEDLVRPGRRRDVRLVGRLRHARRASTAGRSASLVSTRTRPSPSKAASSSTWRRPGKPLRRREDEVRRQLPAQRATGVRERGHQEAVGDAASLGGGEGVVADSAGELHGLEVAPTRCRPSAAASTATLASGMIETCAVAFWPYVTVGSRNLPPTCGRTVVVAAPLTAP